MLLFFSGFLLGLAVANAFLAHEWKKVSNEYGKIAAAYNEIRTIYRALNRKLQ